MYRLVGGAEELMKGWRMVGLIIALTLGWLVFCASWVAYLYYFDWSIPTRLQYLHNYIATLTPFVLDKCMRTVFGLSFYVRVFIVVVSTVFICSLEPVELYDIQLPKLFNTVPLRYFDTCLSRHAEDSGGVIALYYSLQKIIETCENDFSTDMCTQAMADGKNVGEYSRACFLDLMNQPFLYPSEVSARYYMKGKDKMDQWRKETYYFDEVQKYKNEREKEFYLRPFASVRFRRGNYFENHHGDWIRKTELAKKAVLLSISLFKKMDMAMWTNIATFVGSPVQKVAIAVAAQGIQAMVNFYEGSQMYMWIFEFYSNVFLRKPVGFETLLTDFAVNVSTSEQHFDELSNSLYSYCQVFTCMSVKLPTPATSIAIESIRFAERLQNLTDGENVTVELNGEKYEMYQDGHFKMNVTPNELKRFNEFHGLKPDCAFQSATDIVGLMKSCPSILQACIHYQNDNPMFTVAQCPKKCQRVCYADYACNVTKHNYIKNVVINPASEFDQEQRQSKQEKIEDNTYHRWKTFLSGNMFTAVCVCLALIIWNLAVHMVSIYRWIYEKAVVKFPLLQPSTAAPPVRVRTPQASKTPTPAPSRTPSSAGNEKGQREKTPVLDAPGRLDPVALCAGLLDPAVPASAKPRSNRWRDKWGPRIPE